MDVPYDQWTVVGAHNCFTTLYSKTVQNQRYTLQQQFDAGVRAFDIELQKCPLVDDVLVCHG